MKTFSFILLTALLTSNAFAISASSKKVANVVADSLGPIVATTALPVVFAGLVAECLGGDGQDASMACGFASISAPVVTSTSIVLLKEEVKQVEVDAYDFLAGGEITLALAEQMAAIRDLSPQIAAMSDEEVIALMLELGNMK